jgi:hypothetical protein
LLLRSVPRVFVGSPYRPTRFRLAVVCRFRAASMGFIQFYGVKILLEKPRGYVYLFFLENNGFTEALLRVPRLFFKQSYLIMIISLRYQVYSQMKITHLDKSGKPIENSDVSKTLDSQITFNHKDFLFQQMWFCLLLELT